MLLHLLDKCLNDTLPEIDLEARKESSDFIADLLNRFDQYNDDPDKLKELVDKIMEELSSSKAGRALKDTNFNETLDNELQNLLSSAKWKCVDGLLQNSAES